MAAPASDGDSGLQPHGQPIAHRDDFVAS